MSRFPLQLPPGVELFDEFARELVSLLGWTAPEGSLLAEDARVLGQALALAWSRLADAGRENFTNSATDLLSEWEARLGLPDAAGSTDAARQSAATHKRRANLGATRGRVLAMAKVFDTTASIITSPATLCTTYPRGAHTWALAVTASVYYQWGETLRAALAQLKPAHTRVELGTLGDGGYFTCDDADSLTDQTLLGG